MKNLYLLYFLPAVLSFNAKAQNTQGFFLDDWQSKSITSPSYVDTTQSVGTTPTVVNIDFADTIAKVSKYLYGNNGNPYSGNMSSDTKLLQYLNDLNPHVIRWPGGNISQVYFWDRSSTRPSDVPSTVDFWGGKNTSQMTTDNYYSLLAKTHSTGSICVNIAYARYGTGPTPIQTAAHYAANWVRYDNGRTKFWELGNENYGNWEAGYQIDTTHNQDNQPEIINGDLYGKICSVFIDSMRSAASQVGADIKIGAVAMEQLITYDTVQMTWNPEMMAHLADKADFYIVHSYYTPYNENSGVATILNSPSLTKDYVNYITNGLAAVGHGPMPVALTEWNIFAVGSMQDVYYINGMQSAINLGELIKNKYGMAEKWDLSNGWSNGDDMGMFAANNEPGVTYRTPHPQFHYMYYFQKCFGDHMVNSSVKGNTNIVAYASSFASGQCGVVLANKSRYVQNVQLSLDHFQPGKHFYIYTLTGGTDNGDFSRKVYINGQGPSGVAGGPSNYASIKPYGLTTDDSIKVSMPPLSMVYAIIDPASVPDIQWAKATIDTVVQVKLTRAVVVPDTITGFNIMLNGSTADSVTKIVKDGTDSTMLLLTLNQPVMNTDKIVLTYNNGKFMTYDSVALVDNPGMNVENLLSGSSPEILDARTDSAGTAIYVHFNKKMDLATTNSFSVSVHYLDTHAVAISNASFYNGDSTTYALTVSEPLYFDYKVMLSYSGTSVLSSDGGKLAAVDSLLIRNFSPFKPASIQQAYTSSVGDSIILVFDKDLRTTSNLKNYFTVTLDGTSAPLSSVYVNSKETNKLVIRPQSNILQSITAIKVSYSGTQLLSYDSVVVAKFTDQVVQNLSTTIVGIKNFVAPDFTIYPNPIRNAFTINAKFKYTKIKIVDMTGRTVYLKDNNYGFPEKNTITPQLEKGVYLLILTGKDRNTTQKIIVE